MSSRIIGLPFGRASTSTNLVPSGAQSGFGGGSATSAALTAMQAGGGAGLDDFGSGQLPMTEQDLPPPNTKRWVMRRKAEVVAGVRCGLISLDEACRRYTLSVEEFLSWQRLIDSHGVRGLRATRLQDYRSGEGPPADRDGLADGNLAD